MSMAPVMVNSRCDHKHIDWRSPFVRVDWISGYCDHEIGKTHKPATAAPATLLRGNRQGCPMTRRQAVSRPA